MFRNGDEGLSEEERMLLNGHDLPLEVVNRRLFYWVLKRLRATEQRQWFLFALIFMVGSGEIISIFR